MSGDTLQAYLEAREIPPDRLRFLYSHFSFRRESNPAGFAGAVAFWKDLLSAIVLKGLQRGERDSDHLVLRADDSLLERLKWKDAGRPGDLGTVLVCWVSTAWVDRAHNAKKAELAHAKAILPLDTFLSSPASIYSSSWPSWLLSNLVGRPLWWTFRRLGLGSDEPTSPEKAWKQSRGDWVILSNVEVRCHARHTPAFVVESPQLAAELFGKQVDTSVPLSERLFSPASFRERYADAIAPEATLTELDIRVLLKFLERDRKVLVTSGDTIKVLVDGEPEGISEVDKSVLKVVEAVSSLQRQVDSLEKRIAECNRKAASCVKASNKEGVRSALRTRQLLTSTLAERTSQLENISAVRMRIDNAASDTAVLAAYEAATHALRHLTPDRDRVDAVTDALSDAMADQKEVQNMLNAVGTEHAIQVDDEELEAELASLLQERRSELVTADGQKEGPSDEPSANALPSSEVAGETEAKEPEVRESVPAE